ncbi:hypothetical protein ACTXT7_003745 [Hymenolepis weldensis]
MRHWCSTQFSRLPSERSCEQCPSEHIRLLEAAELPTSGHRESNSNFTCVDKRVMDKERRLGARKKSTHSENF